MPDLQLCFPPMLDPAVHGRQPNLRGLHLLTEFASAAAAWRGVVFQLLHRKDSESTASYKHSKDAHFLPAKSVLEVFWHNSKQEHVDASFASKTTGPEGRITLASLVVRCDLLLGRLCSVRPQLAEKLLLLFLQLSSQLFFNSPLSCGIHFVWLWGQHTL